ncbi:MAG TPA: glycosyltransferase [Gemmatimonadales bacterium]|nr:glycosyltransferase [Gemmatimonadales bacterium]
MPYALRAFLLPYARHFRAMGWRVGAAASGEPLGLDGVNDRTWDDATREAFPERFNLELRRGLRGATGVMATARRLRDIVATHEFDLVHVHTPVVSIAARLGLYPLRRANGVRLIYTAHGFHFHSGRSWLGNAPWAAIERSFVRLTDWLVVMNEEDLQAARSWPGIAPDRVVPMPGIGVDLSLYGGPRGRAAFAGLGITEDQPILLMLGELRANKRVGDAIRALARLRDSRAVLCVAGAGPLLHTWMAMAESLGLGGRVKFLGYRTDVPALLAGADALVFCTEREGLPRSVMEAMAAGVPVVATDIRGNRDLLAPTGGLLYPLGDVNALTHCLSRLLTDRELVVRLAEAGQRSVPQYELGRVLALHEELYGRVLAAGAPSTVRRGRPRRNRIGTRGTTGFGEPAWVPSDAWVHREPSHPALEPLSSLSAGE